MFASASPAPRRNPPRSSRSSSGSKRSAAPKRIVVEALSLADLIKITGHPLAFPAVTYAGWLVPKRKGAARKLIAYGGLAWRTADRDTGQLWCEMWFNIAEPRLIRTLTLVRWARKMLLTAQQLGEDVVFSVREDRPQSEKLLSLVGMTLAPDLRTFGDDAERPGEVFLWRRSQDSEQH